MKRKTKKILSIKLSEYKNHQNCIKNYIDEILYPHNEGSNVNAGIRSSVENSVENRAIQTADKLGKLKNDENYVKLEKWIHLVEKLQNYYFKEDKLKYTILLYKFINNDYVPKNKDSKKRYTDIDIIQKLQLEGYNIEKTNYYVNINDILNDAYAIAISYDLMISDII